MRQATRRALAFHPRHPEDWLAWALRLALAAAVLASPWVPGWEPPLRASMALLALGGLGAAALIAAVPSHEPRLLRGVEAALTALVLANYLGHVFGLYGNTRWFDVTLHAASGILAGLGGYWVARATRLFWPPGHETPFRAFWVAFSMALVLGAVFELAEFGADAFLGAQTQRSPGQPPIEDTMTDIFAETLTGIAVGLAVAAWSRWRHGKRSHPLRHRAGS